MCQNIPMMRDSIKEASMSDLKDFLESIRKHSARIGEIAMRQVIKKYVYLHLNAGCSFKLIYFN
jgi:hypothetical protein